MCVCVCAREEGGCAGVRVWVEGGGVQTEGEGAGLEEEAGTHCLALLISWKSLSLKELILAGNHTRHIYRQTH